MAAPTARERILDAARTQVLRHGFAATTVDAILESAEASKGAFFHHFPSKAHLGRALVERYVEQDIDHLETVMASAEAQSSDPAEQLLIFTRTFEQMADDAMAEQPQCLFVSFIYESELSDVGIEDLVFDSVMHWRARIVEKLELAAATRPRLRSLDLSALADHWFATFEGSFLLAQAVDDPSCMRRQLAHLRGYLELLFEFEAPANP
jgi:TetR/AcrR family transcriptional repressor of nem operon